MSIIVQIADLAAEQWGLVTTAQARILLGARAAIMADLADQGALERMSHGVYRLTGTPITPLDGLHAAWIALEPAVLVRERLHEAHPAVVSHRSAAKFHRLGDLDADAHEFTLPSRKRTRRSDFRLHVQTLDSQDWAITDGLPVTTATRTIVDLAASHTDGGHLSKVVHDALISLQTTDERLSEALRPYAHYYGAPLGNGEALLKQFLQETGTPDSLARAIALSAPEVNLQAAYQQLHKAIASNPQLNLFDSAASKELLHLLQGHSAQIVKDYFLGLAASPEVSKLRKSKETDHGSD